MVMERQHYMTLCDRDNTVVTHKVNNNGCLEVTFEQSCNNGFKTLVFDQYGKLIYNDGFNNADISYFFNFLQRNISVMLEEARGEL
jgi:hypothetical protein